MLGVQQREEALVHFRRGLSLERANRPSEAVREYRQALVCDPHLCEARTALAEYYQRRGLLAKAVEELRIIANLQGDFLAHYQLGCLLTEVGQPEAAIDALEHCLSMLPDDPLVRYRLAAAHFQSGAYAAALTHLSDSAYGWEPHLLRGDCLLRLGSYAAAWQAFAQAERLAPPEARGQAIARARTAARYGQVGTPRTMRDWLYAEHGAVFLGTPQLDSSRREPVDFPLTYPDIGAALRRLAGLAAALGWSFDRVAALDVAARPAAEALADLLGLPLGEGGARPLLVLASGYREELGALALERAGERSALLCLGLGDMRARGAAPDIVGVAAHGVCGAPWEPELRRLRAGGAPQDKIAACLARAADLTRDAAAAAPLDEGLAELADYYQRRGDLRLASRPASAGPVATQG